MGIRSTEGGKMDPYSIIESWESGQHPTVDETEAVLAYNDPEFNSSLYQAASRVRDKTFGKSIFMYGFVYFSTYCKNNCNFCYFRRSNSINRYRKTKEEVLEIATGLENAGINLVDLTMGEDPQLYADDYQDIVDLVKNVREVVDTGIMISPGAVSRSTMPKLRMAGADFFAVYQETANRELFSKLRVEQDYDFRMNQRIWAKEAGMLVEDGMLVGIGETPRDRAEHIKIMGEMGCEQIRAMTFIPQKGTPLQNVAPPVDYTDELKAIAVMRLTYPDVLIPATLDVEGIAGLKSRVDAGASVITSIVPPNIGLAGVAQPEFDIDDGHRSLDYVRSIAESLGRREATMKEFKDYCESHRPKERIKC